MADKTKQWQAKAVTAVFGILAWFLGMAAALVGASPAGAREPMRFQDAYHDGYALVLWENTSVDELETKLARIRQTGATHLIIPYFGCQSDIHSSDVGSCQVLFRTAANVLARDAIELGFTEVSYLPIVATPDWQWRGYFDPKDVDGWFKSYTAWIKGVARDAKKLGMKELVVGSEMTKLYRYEDQWKKVLAEVRTVFDGPLVLTVNWGDTDHSFWADADAIGVSAYYPLSDNVNPTQDELDAAWQARRAEFHALSNQWQRPIHITETGYSSVSSAAHTPWAAAPGDTSDLALQARCFEAFRKAWSGDRSLVRANIWATEVESPDSGGFSMSFETIGKPAEEVLKRFFSERLDLSAL